MNNLNNSGGSLLVFSLLCGLLLPSAQFTFANQLQLNSYRGGYEDKPQVAGSVFDNSIKSDRVHKKSSARYITRTVRIKKEYGDEYYAQRLNMNSALTKPSKLSFKGGSEDSSVSYSERIPPGEVSVEDIPYKNRDELVNSNVVTSSTDNERVEVSIYRPRQSSSFEEYGVSSNNTLNRLQERLDNKRAYVAVDKIEGGYVGRFAGTQKSRSSPVLARAMLLLRGLFNSKARAVNNADKKDVESVDVVGSSVGLDTPVLKSAGRHEVLHWSTESHVILGAEVGRVLFVSGDVLGRSSKSIVGMSVYQKYYSALGGVCVKVFIAMTSLKKRYCGSPYGLYVSDIDDE